MDFDAVIGIGGIGHEAQVAAIAGKITWVGIGAHRAVSSDRGPQITFDKFVLFESRRKELIDIAPTLARRFYTNHGPRYVFDENLTDVEKLETKRILRMAQSAPSSNKTSVGGVSKKTRRCHFCY
jgi:hypothetical protein